MPYPSDPTARALSDVTDRWITVRDRLRANPDRPGVRVEFLRELEGHANVLGEVLPGLTIAQVEALCELSSSWLTWMRMREAAFRK